jgi:hypothetical protein
LQEEIHVSGASQHQAAAVHLFLSSILLQPLQPWWMRVLPYVVEMSPLLQCASQPATAPHVTQAAQDTAKQHATNQSINYTFF